MRQQKIRILKFLSFFAVGGTERQFVNLIKRLDPDRFELHLACFRRFGAFLPEVEAGGWPLQTFQIERMVSYNTCRRQLQFARYLCKHGIQVVHTYGWYANVFGIPAARLAGVPVRIASIRDMGAHITDNQLKVQRMVCRMATSVLVNSEAIQKWLVSDGYASDKIHLIRNGIVTQVPELTGSLSIREQYGIAPDAPLVGMICRINPVKAVGDFLEAIAMVMRQHPSARFLIVGDGEERLAMMERARELGLGERVIFAGLRTDAPQILPQLTISVLSSLTEGLSNTVLESMAAGVPVVATRVGGNCEIVADGETGFLVPPRNPEMLSQAICRLLSNPQLATQMGAAGKECIARNFTVETVVHQTEQLYENLLKQKRVAA
jgi:L-malate glycosyltransferase